MSTTKSAKRERGRERPKAGARTKARAQTRTSDNPSIRWPTETRHESLTKLQIMIIIYDRQPVLHIQQLGQVSRAHDEGQLVHMSSLTPASEFDGYAKRAKMSYYRVWPDRKILNHNIRLHTSVALMGGPEKDRKS